MTFMFLAQSNPPVRYVFQFSQAGSMFFDAPESVLVCMYSPRPRQIRS